MIKKIVVGQLQTNCYIVYKGHQAILVDPGDNHKKINRFLKVNELELQAILLTHGHIDHIGAINSFLVEHPLLPIYIHQEDIDFLTHPEMNLSLSFTHQPYVVNGNVIAIQDEQVLDIANMQITCRHYAGHTPGSCMYFLENEKIIFSGDVLFEKSIGRFDLPYGSRSDTIQSLRKIMTLTEDYTIYPGHDQKTTLYEELQFNPYFIQLK